MKTAILAVTNDLTTDQRVHRTCTELVSMGFHVVLTGRHLRTSKPLVNRGYEMARMRLLFDKGPLFYAEYNLRLFFHLLTAKANLIVTNDTDTLLAGFLASRIRRIPLLHDCHEYFSGVPELVGRKTVTKAWKGIENLIFPRLKYIVAVNDSVAELYRREYHVPIHVVRNVPFRKEKCGGSRKEAMGIPPQTKVILYQGAVNIDRGLEEMIHAMKLLRQNAVFVIVGIGDLSDKLKELVEKENLGGRVLFAGQIPFQELHHYTCMADIGLSIEKEAGINYQNCLPNKFLDYIQSRVPVLVTPFPEMKKIVEQYDIGAFIHDHRPENLAAKLDAMLGEEDALRRYRANLEQAANDLCWENESKILKDLINEIH